MHVVFGGEHPDSITSSPVRFRFESAHVEEGRRCGLAVSGTLVQPGNHFIFAECFEVW